MNGKGDVLRHAGISLVVPEAFQRSSLARFLSAEGHNVCLEVGKLSQLTEAAESGRLSGVHVAVIAGQIDGKAAAEIIKAANPDIKVVDATPNSGEDAGFSDDAVLNTQGFECLLAAIARF